MTKVIVAGAAGRMGGRIVQMVQERPELELVAAFESAEHPAVGKDAGLVNGLAEIGVAIAPGLERVIDLGEVIIDFTFHAATARFAELAARHGRAMVIGTTGFSSDELARLKQLADAHFPCVLSPNMAVGVNVLFKLVEKAATILGDAYDVEIVEAHHRLKKDAPSGTALKLGQVAAQALGRDWDQVAVMERRGIIGERSNTEIGIQTVRGGDIIGDHTVCFAGIGERLELIHRASSRDNFARGAALAASWVKDKPGGMYSMFDVLGLETI